MMIFPNCLIRFYNYECMATKYKHLPKVINKKIDANCLSQAWIIFGNRLWQSFYKQLSHCYTNQPMSALLKLQLYEAQTYRYTIGRISKAPV